MRLSLDTPGQGRRRLRRALLFVLVLAIGGGMIVELRQRLLRMVEGHLLANPRSVTASPADLGLRHVSGFVETATERRVHYWWVSAPPESERDASVTPSVLIFHGQGEVVQDWLPAIRALALGGRNVMIFDYSGYGLSDNAHNTRGWPEDVAAILEEFESRATGPRLALGFSMGGAVLLDNLAQVEARVCAMAIVSTFASLRQVVADRFAPLDLMPELLPERFASTSAIAAVRRPTLLLQVTGDEVIGAAHFEALAEAASPAVTARTVDSPHDHNQFWKDPRSPAFVQVAGFFDRSTCEGSLDVIRD